MRSITAPLLPNTHYFRAGNLITGRGRSPCFEKASFAQSGALNLGVFLCYSVFFQGIDHGEAT
jgi:hypothetical protein